MATAKETDHTEYFAALKEATDPDAMQEIVMGSSLSDKDEVMELYESLLVEAEDASDAKNYPPAAEGFRKESVLAWALNDSRLVESVSTQALYYGTLTGYDAMLKNFATVWAIWAHVLPQLKPKERARLGDFARFSRSFQLGMREADADRVGDAVVRLAPAFARMGELNLKAIEDKKLDFTDDLQAMWDDVSKLIDELAR